MVVRQSKQINKEIAYFDLLKTLRRQGQVLLLNCIQDVKWPESLAGYP